MSKAGSPHHEHHDQQQRPIIEGVGGHGGEQSAAPFADEGENEPDGAERWDGGPPLWVNGGEDEAGGQRGEPPSAPLPPGREKRAAEKRLLGERRPEDREQPDEHQRDWRAAGHVVDRV